MGRKPLSTVPAEVTLTLRMTPDDRTLLDKLVALRAAELAEMGATEVDVTSASYLRGLIRREAKAKGITPTAVQVTAPAKPIAAAKPSGAEDPLRVALNSAIERGETQANIAKRAKVDASLLSKFRRDGRGLSPESREKLERTLKVIIENTKR